MFPSLAPELLPPKGCFDITNGLLDEEGVVYRRGGSVYVSPTPAGHPRLLWSGFLKHGGQQTIIATDLGTYRLSPTNTLENLGFTIAAGMTRAEVFQGVLYMQGGHTWDGTTHTTEGVAPGFAATAANRLISAAGSTVKVGTVPAEEGGVFTFPAVNYFSLPGGAEIVGAQGLRSSCVVFTTEGIWLLSGLEHEIVDAEGNVQWRQDLYAPNAVVWGTAGVVGYQGGLVVPCKDNIYLMELGVSSEKAAPFVKISEAIQAPYRAYVAAGYEPGIATVYRGHYFLPILSGATVVDVLVCRLDATNSRGAHTFPWTHLKDYGARVAAYCVTEEEQAFLGLSQAEGKLMRCDTYFAPAHGVSADADGSTHSFSVTYRDIATGGLIPNTVKYVRLRYQMTAPSTSYLTLGFGDTNFGGALWDDFNWDEADWAGDVGFTEQEGHAPGDPSATDPFTWRVGRKVRYARVRVSQVGPSSSTSLRTLELAIRADSRVF